MAEHIFLPLNTITILSRPSRLPGLNMADNAASSSSSALSPNEQLLAAASAGDLPTIKSLLTTPPSDPSSSSSSTAPAALAQPWYESPTCLGWSALHFAAERGHTHVIKYLLRNGAIWNAVDIHGVTAGEVAWSGNWDGAYRALLDGESEEAGRKGELD